MPPLPSDPFDDKEALLESPSTPSIPSIYHDVNSHQPQTPFNYRNALRAAPPILAGTCWLTMMTYFLIYYETLPRDSDGKLPRIGPAYSTFPYISCIGAVRLPFFRGFASTVASLSILTFILDFWTGRNVGPGRWFRRAKLCFGTISSIFLIMLSMESVNSGNHLHLIFTSIQIWSMGAAKLSDYFMSYLMRRHDRQNKHLLFGKLWKKCVGIIAAPASAITIVGIYGCSMPVGLLPSTATCWKLTSFAAPSEWILALCWISYLYALGYDLYHAETVAARIISLTGQNGRGHSKSPSAAMRELRLAKVLEEDHEGFSYRPRIAMPGKSKYASVQAQEVDDERDDMFELGSTDSAGWAKHENKDFV